jgi:hypothetical protein
MADKIAAAVAVIAVKTNARVRVSDESVGACSYDNSGTATTLRHNWPL